MRPTRKTEGRERCCLSPASRSGAVTRRFLHHHHHCLQTAIYFFFLLSFMNSNQSVVSSRIDAASFFSHLPVCVKSKRTTAIKMQIRSQALPRPLDVDLIADRRRPEFQSSYLSHPAKLSGTKVLPAVHLSCPVGISLNPHTLLSAVVLGKIKNLSLRR